ncbi:prolyl-tRNA synthetase [Candidatus Adlerbacteria bacterium RIFCSPHIGHO2_01_FULL_54_23]|uniref:Proline--tRNA ligase n=3 Tax=Candidatus Adleribacteriota TaxID=1752736 RepID=A0A1F4Y0S9_9BACT|nr:MAG: Proline-tRNA ligase [Candidatus Adlerbacteria bacterium GW2011_GWA1_54_10]KKW37921.1 MAG: Proline-tRNA ligase [Candidatus Adlerbacteria bacterium GW2011_GWB1_54_7]OGC78532.1 MAG: prolyl-tRNA synthetase [Candidatus Adlerbacteria bacterium RIFCSPHIGHO2_01_FULL_54_23]OGC87542.1 MAG: prolyl-tRNA synthetase [Candidatus Adlerbacteria bacterium RIFCSPLOWO2_01_FULL_54_16]
MRQSQLFTKTRREAPKDEVSRNAQLLIRAGYIHKEMAGVYDFLPLGLRTLNKVIQIIREEMNAIGGIELNLSTLQSPELWQKTDRWDEKKVDSWFKTRLQSGGELGLGFTHEEPLTALMREHITSWRDLPVYAYQFQTKFRNEVRAKSGLMRTREFLMKDLYSFCKNEAEHIACYDRVSDAYVRIFERAGLGNKTYKTFASGGSFSQFSHEFQTVCKSGEDTIYISKENNIAINKEVFTEDVKKKLNLGENFIEEKAIEVGNIFTLGNRFSEPLGLAYTDEQGNNVPVFMGSYGIGPARLMATVAETFADGKGLVWPEDVAPFRVHLVELSGGEAEIKKEADELYRNLTDAGVEVLYDDRDLRAGEKFVDSDLIGIPMRIIVSQKSLAEGNFECIERATGHTAYKSLPELIGQLTARL